MKKYSFAGESFTTGVVRYRDLGYLLATRDELVPDGQAHSAIYGIDRGDIGAVDVNWLAASCCVCKWPEEKLLVISHRGGRALTVGGGSVNAENLTEDSKSFNRRGFLREVRAIGDGKAFAVGTGRQVYRREGPGNWVCIDKWSHSRDVSRFSFESIDGFAEDDLYAVGWRGEIWHFDGKKWEQIESPTNLSLYRVRCSPDGYVYACGQQGTVLRGLGSAWEVVDQSKTEEDFWGLEIYEDKVYLSTTHLIYSFDGEEDFSLVHFGLMDAPRTCYHLSAADGIIWSIGAKDVVQFDGRRWERIV